MREVVLVGESAKDEARGGGIGLLWVLVGWIPVLGDLVCSYHTGI